MVRLPAASTPPSCPCQPITPHITRRFANRFPSNQADSQFVSYTENVSLTLPDPLWPWPTGEIENGMLTFSMQLLKYMRLDQKGNAMAEYIWIDAVGHVRSKSKVRFFSLSIFSWLSLSNRRDFCYSIDLCQTMPHSPFLVTLFPRGAGTSWVEGPGRSRLSQPAPHPSGRRHAD